MERNYIWKEVIQGDKFVMERNNEVMAFNSHQD
jgi:hypothetical protein